MKPKIICLTLTLALLVPAAFADSGYQRELAELSAQRDKAIAEASEPINRRYQAALEQLLRRATQANDLDAAVKIKDALVSSPLGSRLQGSWINKGIKSRIQFTPDGVFKESWNDEVQEGQWEALSDTDVKVTLKKGPVHQYHLSDDGKSVKRTLEGYVWTRGK